MFFKGQNRLNKIKLKPIFKNYFILTFEFSILLTIAVGLFNTGHFYSETYTAYYLFCVVALLTTVIYVTLPNQCLIKNRRVIIYKPFIFFAIWNLYVLCHYLNHTAKTLVFIYYIVLFLVLLAWTAIVSFPQFKAKRLCYGIVVISTIESLYCLGQYFHFFESGNELFVVTGSWTNPNITAQFLAMAVPVFLYLLQSKFKRAIQLSGFIILIALALLKCRSAYIGAVVSILVYYSLKYNFTLWLRNPKNRTSLKALIIGGLLLIIPVLTQLYNTKKASADGRQFIWKLSAMMVTEKPLTGYGYGSFAREFNLYQANYILEGKATQEEQYIAGPTIVAHNELLQNIVEGGSIGLLLFLLFFGSILFSIRKYNKFKNEPIRNEVEFFDKDKLFYASYAGVVSFLSMSMFNFTFQAVPVMTLLILYTAILCSQFEPVKIQDSLGFLNMQWIKGLVSIVKITLSVLIIFTIVQVAYADSLNKKALVLKKQGHFKEALHNMPALEPWLKEESNYWKNYGNLLFLNKEYSAAIYCLKKAKETNCKPELYLGTGLCYEKMGQLSKAIQQYRIAVALHPSKFKYRFNLLSVFLQKKDTLNILHTAQEIVDLKPKIPSDEVVRYKKMAQKVILIYDKEAKNKIKFTRKLFQKENYSLNKLH